MKYLHIESFKPKRGDGGGGHLDLRAGNVSSGPPAHPGLLVHESPRGVFYNSFKFD